MDKENSSNTSPFVPSKGTNNPSDHNELKEATRRRRRRAPGGIGEAFEPNEESTKEVRDSRQASNLS
eukprot:CAMPEP_0198140752 /NCGR_PEP_ID=MMETSP1443-20131203/3869_1 /TAXON_ID=186043 /ORGANISM="Entomoneis sp., Strain CCMP2396" /LENGTH=66 /DNA_ID=CAMNT_0043803277 /DNA_START=84 /DNA_END=281 /DNA_ORIENTATION=+